MSKFLEKILTPFREKYPPEFSHMKRISTKFYLSDTNIDGARSLYWDGEFIVRVQGVVTADKDPEKKCFILANGPSLTDIDLHLLTGNDTYCVNGSIVKYRDSGLSPTHYTITDPSFFEKKFNLVEEALRSKANFYFTFDALNKICERDVSLLKGKSIFLYSRVNQKYRCPAFQRESLFELLRDKNDVFLSDVDDALIINGNLSRRGFSLNPEIGCFGGATVVYDALQLSGMMGYENIYIAGMDLGSIGEAVRFYDSKGDGGRKSRLDKDFESIIEPSFQLIKDRVLSKNFKVFNLSDASRLSGTVIEKVDLKNILND